MPQMCIRDRLRLRTRLLDDHKTKSTAAVGFVSGCDTLGCYVIVARRENPDQTTTLAVVCLHVSGEVRSGYVLTGQSSARAQSLCQEVASESGTRFIEAPIAKLMPLVENAAEKTLLGGRQAVSYTHLPGFRAFRTANRPRRDRRCERTAAAYQSRARWRTDGQSRCRCARSHAR